MESSMMKNIVILKNLPSNLVEEAFVVLKENEKIQIEEIINHDNLKKNETKIINECKEDRDYIVKEAELLVSNYIKDIENKKNENKKNIWKIKYERSKILNVFLIVLSTITIIKSFI